MRRSRSAAGGGQHAVDGTSAAVAALQSPPLSQSLLSQASVSIQPISVETLHMLDRMHTILTCQICRQPFNNPHSLRSCQHHFCEGCIVPYVEKHCKCPVCPMHAFHKDIQPNATINSLLEHYHSLRVWVERKRQQQESDEAIQRRKRRDEDDGDDGDEDERRRGRRRSGERKQKEDSDTHTGARKKSAPSQSRSPADHRKRAHMNEPQNSFLAVDAPLSSAIAPPQDISVALPTISSSDNAATTTAPAAAAAVRNFKSFRKSAACGNASVAAAALPIPTVIPALAKTTSPTLASEHTHTHTVDALFDDHRMQNEMDDEVEVIKVTKVKKEAARARESHRIASAAADVAATAVATTPTAVKPSAPSARAGPSKLTTTTLTSFFSAVPAVNNATPPTASVSPPMNRSPLVDTSSSVARAKPPPSFASSSPPPPPLTTDSDGDIHMLVADVTRMVTALNEVPTQLQHFAALSASTPAPSQTPESASLPPAAHPADASSPAATKTNGVVEPATASASPAPALPPVSPFIPPSAVSSLSPQPLVSTQRSSSSAQSKPASPKQRPRDAATAAATAAAAISAGAGNDVAAAPSLNSQEVLRQQQKQHHATISDASPTLSRPSSSYTSPASGGSANNAANAAASTTPVPTSVSVSASPPPALPIQDSLSLPQAFLSQGQLSHAVSKQSLPFASMPALEPAPLINIYSQLPPPWSPTRKQRSASPENNETNAIDAMQPSPTGPTTAPAQAAVTRDEPVQQQNNQQPTLSPSAIIPAAAEPRDRVAVNANANVDESGGHTAAPGSQPAAAASAPVTLTLDQSMTLPPVAMPSMHQAAMQHRSNENEGVAPTIGECSVPHDPAAAAALSSNVNDRAALVDCAAAPTATPANALPVAAVEQPQLHRERADQLSVTNHLPLVANPAAAPSFAIDAATAAAAATTPATDAPHTNAYADMFIAFTTLDAQQKSLLSAFCARVGTRLHVGRDWSPHITHLVTRCNGRTATAARRPITSRSLKYMQALLSGCWIVEWKWVEASIQAGRWVEEDAYEMAGDVITRGGDIPRLCRERRERCEAKLLQGVKLCILPPLLEKKDPDVQQLEQLIDIGGGILIQTPLALVSDVTAAATHTLSVTPANNEEQLNGVPPQAGEHAAVVEARKHAITPTPTPASSSADTPSPTQNHAAARSAFNASAPLSAPAVPPSALLRSGVFVLPPAAASSAGPIHLLCRSDASKVYLPHAMKHIANKYGMLPVTVNWLLDSISNNRLADYHTFRCDMTQTEKAQACDKAAKTTTVNAAGQVTSIFQS